MILRQGSSPIERLLNHKQFALSTAKCMLAVVFLGALSGCSEDGADPAPVITDIPDRFVVYTGGGLHAIDTLDPSLAGVTLGTGDTRGQTMAAVASWPDSGSKISRQTLGIFEEDGKLWKIDLRTESTLAKVRVSSASLADACFPDAGQSGLYVVYTNYIDIAQSKVMWKTMGVDGKCETTGDNKWFLATLGDSETTAPVDITSKLTSPTVHVGAGEILAAKDKQLIRYDSNFDNPVVIATAANSFELRVADSGVGTGDFVKKDGTLYWYAHGADALSEPLFTPMGSTSYYRLECDATHCYIFGDISNGEATLYRLPNDGSAAAQIFVPKPPGSEYECYQRQLTKNFIYYVHASAGKEELYRVAKTSENAGAPVLVDAAQTLTQRIRLFTGGENLYYTLEDDAIKSAKAIVRAEDGTLIATFSDSLWVGSSYEYDGNNFVKSPSILATGVVDPSAIGGAALKVYDRANNSVGIALGTLPDGVANISYSPFPGGNVVLFTAKIKDSNAPVDGKQSDVFGLDLTRENSLRRITATSNVDEGTVW